MVTPIPMFLTEMVGTSLTSEQIDQDLKNFGLEPEKANHLKQFVRIVMHLPALYCNVMQ